MVEIVSVFFYYYGWQWSCKDCCLGCVYGLQPKNVQKWLFCVYLGQKVCFYDVNTASKKFNMINKDTIMVMQKTCRSCMSESTDMRNLFETKEAEERPPVLLAEMLMACASIQVLLLF